MAELSLDHVELHAFTGHLDSVGAAKLMRREPTTNAGPKPELPERRASGGCRPWAPLSWARDHAQQRPESQLATNLEPRIDLLPSPRVHTYLAALPTLATADEDAAATPLEVGLREGKRLAQTEPRTPEQRHERARPEPVGRVAGCAHDSDHLWDGRRIGRVAETLVAWRPPAVEAGLRCW